MNKQISNLVFVSFIDNDMVLNDNKNLPILVQ